MNIPNNFKNDIQSRDTNLQPIVAIGSTESLLYIGVSNITLSNGITTLPILLSIPSLKESIDISSRKYKISNLTLQLSNVEYNGQRFSDRYAMDSLMNTEVRIWWKSQSTETPTMFDTGVAYADNSLFQIYYGQIRKYSHTDETVSIVIEDRSQSKLHTYLPRTYSPDEDYMPDKYRNKPIPIVYGQVDRSPLMADYTKISDASGDILELELKADTEGIASFQSSVEQLSTTDSDGIQTDTDKLNISPLYFHDNEHYFNVAENVDEELVASEITNFTMHTGADGNGARIVLDTDSVEGGSGGNYINNDISKGILRSHMIRRVKNITAHTVQGGQGGTVPNIELEDGIIAKIQGRIEYSAPGGSPFQPSRWGSAYAKCYIEAISAPSDIVKDYELSDTHSTDLYNLKTWMFINIDHWNFHGYANSPPYNQADNPGVSDITGWGIWVGGDGQVSDNEYSTTINYSNDTEILNGFDHDGTGMISALAWDNITGNINDYAPNARTDKVVLQRNIGGTQTPDYEPLFDSLNQYTYVKIGIPRHDKSTDSSGDLHVDTTIKDLFFVHRFFVFGVTDKDYYANVIGRPYYSMPQIVENIMNVELGQSITAGTYTDYTDMKYAFTVHKKINSKRLIEELSSVSPYIPRFNNMGEFKFDVIPTLAWNDNTNTAEARIISHTIDALEVITYSYNRTPIDDVYSKVEFHYNYNYAEDNAQSKVEVSMDEFTDIDYDPTYYGFQSIDGNAHAESTLVIDDDRSKYIRNGEVADKFASWMLLQYCNQHLTIKVRLPLKYLAIEVGELLEFDTIIGDVKPYGIDYSKTAEYNKDDAMYIGAELNGQQIFPIFICTATNKTLEYVEVTCMMLHNLEENKLMEDAEEVIEEEEIALGDLNGDTSYNVLDILSLAECIRNNSCDQYGDIADMNGDESFNILDIVALVTCILNNSCEG